MRIRTENLAVMLTDVKGFTAASSRQSREESARMLAVQDELVLPVVRAFGGRRVKTIGDAYLVVFPAPTSGLLCGMAIQDRLWDYGRRVPPGDRIEVRVTLTLGEVRLVGRGRAARDVHGEAVSLATRIEAAAGEIWFSEAVRLVADPAQVEAEDLGPRRLEAMDEEVHLFRVVRAPTRDGEEAPPYGNVALARVAGLAPPDPETLARAIRWRESALFVPGRRAAELAAAIPLRPAIALAIVALFALVAGPAWRSQATAVERRIDAGDLAGAEKAIEARAAERGAGDPRVLYLRGRLAAARAALGGGDARDNAYGWWARAAAAGSGDALAALRDEAGAWECERRRMAARALGDSRSSEALPILRGLRDRSAEESGGDGACGAAEVARDAIRFIEAR